MDIEIEKRNFFKKYNTLETLKYISNKNIIEFNDSLKKIKFDNIPFLNVRIAYNVIKYSNDFRGIKELNDNEIKKIYSKIIKNFSHKKNTNNSSLENLLEIIIGHSQEQFWRQEIFNFLINTILRNAKILSYYDLNTSIDEILSRELKININIKQFEVCLNILVGLFLAKNIYLENEIIDNIEKSIKNSKINIKIEQVINILNYYSCNYEWIRSKEEKNRPFFIKPIVKNNKEYILIDMYSLLYKYSDGVYWIIRNYYNNYGKDRAEFVRKFGTMFEEYIKDLLEYLLKEKNFYKLENSENKQKLKIADWIIKTKKYNLIVEQKSIMLLSEFKVMEINVKKFEEVFIKKIQKAFYQLQSTEKLEKLNDKKNIKLILLYEYLPNLEVLKAYFEDLLKNEIADLENYLLITIDEFEKLITVLKNNEELFNKIMEEKLELEKFSLAKSNFNNILKKYKCDKNEYTEYLDINKEF